jgi:general secretion pathway protein G
VVGPTVFGGGSATSLSSLFQLANLGLTTMCTQRSARARQAFTLIEILIVVVILGILAAIVIPQFTDASLIAARNNLRTQLQTVRSQMELYNVQNPGDPYEADGAPDAFGGPGLANFWNALVQGNYLQRVPNNPLTPDPATNDPTAVAAAVAVGGAWVWAESSPGDAWTLNIYGVDENGNLFSDPDTGVAY